MQEKRRKTTVEFRVGICDICAENRLLHRHHILEFSKFGESLDFWAICGSCHDMLHVGINAIIHKKKRATEVWDLLCSTLGENHKVINQVKEKVYETAEFAIDRELNY